MRGDVSIASYNDSGGGVKLFLVVSVVIHS